MCVCVCQRVSVHLKVRLCMCKPEANPAIRSPAWVVHFFSSDQRRVEQIYKKNTQHFAKRQNTNAKRDYLLMPYETYYELKNKTTTTVKRDQFLIPKLCLQSQCTAKQVGPVVTSYQCLGKTNKKRPITKAQIDRLLIPLQQYRSALQSKLDQLKSLAEGNFIENFIKEFVPKDLEAEDLEVRCSAS